MKDNTPIVIVAFNRSYPLKRLLTSLGEANYPALNITLIISIDKSDKNGDVLNIANEFDWKFGDKIVNYNKENLGLRKHVIKCASYALTYGSVIVLEDDLYVSPNFYNYATHALKFSNGKGYISGISLYNHQLNVNNRWHFSPIEDGFDNWYFQFASSWGQAWTKEQWKEFHGWYLEHQILKPCPEIPANISRWSDKSWLKYFIYFLVEKDKYFLYPKISLTSNFSEYGTHVKKFSTTFQTPLAFFSKHKYKFSKLEQSNAIYDAFYENNLLFRFIGLPRKELCVDLQQTKPVKNFDHSYLLSSKLYNYKIIRSFGQRLKPIDANIICSIDGDDIFLYDTSKIKKNTNISKHNRARKIMYNIKHISRRDAKFMFITLYTSRISEMLKKLFK